VSQPVYSRRAVAALFLARQQLDRPRARRLTAASLANLVGETCGLQIDSVNVLERAHLITLWSRFGAFERATFDRLVYRRRVLFEYISHVACFVDARDLPLWRAIMDQVPGRFCRRHRYPGRRQPFVDQVEREIAARAPLGNSGFERPKGTKGGGWWTWKPATHALDYLWKAGRIAVHSRRNFEKLYAPMASVLPAAASVTPLAAADLPRERVLRSLRALGAATLDDLVKYWTWPSLAGPELRRAMAALAHDGLVTELAVDGEKRPYFARTEDLPALATAARTRRPSRGTTLLCPFDSFLWHRERVRRLWGFHYRIEIYVPGHQRTHGYYVLPVLHEGQLVGRVDPKLHRERGVLEARRVGFEPWLVSGARPPGADWGPVDRDAAIRGVAECLHSLARFTGAKRVTLGRVTPSAWRAPLARALRAAAPAP
jgi:hypothetical protein